MSGWGMFVLVLIVLFLIGQIRVGVDAKYGEDGALVRVRLGLIRIKVFPLPTKDNTKQNKKKKPKNQKSAKAPEKKAGKKLTLEEILQLAREFIPLALETAGCFWNKLVMDELELSITVGGTDPADTAMLYGQIHAAMGAVWQSLTTAFHVKNGRAHIDVDFQAQNMVLYAHAALSIKIGQIVWIALYFGVRALSKLFKFFRNKNAKQQQRKAV